jgi:hypothetical protein
MNKSSVILIVGAGQLGSRHLQGLAKCTNSLSIFVVDVNPKALQLAQQRWLEVVSEYVADKEVSFHTDLSQCSNDVDLVIVATTARKRVQLVSLIKEHVTARFWILEKVLAQSVVELDQLLVLMGTGCKVWVNTPRRMLPWHKLIRDRFTKQSPLHLRVTGKVWGLACNAIHFLDMLTWFSGESLSQISTEGLSSKWLEAKRPGNWEIMGKLTAQFSGGSTATLIVEEGDPMDLCYQFEIDDRSFKWLIDEENGCAVRSDGVSIAGRLPFQSEVTPLLVDEILTTGKCELPSLSISVEVHRVFLGAMLDHWRNTMNSTETSVPIT